MRALVITAHGFEDSELLVPVEILQDAGVEVEIAGLEAGPIRGKHGTVMWAKLGLEDIEPTRYDLLLVPGGKAPAALASDRDAIAVVRDFFARDKPVGAICHGAELLAAAGVLRGRDVTCHRGIAAKVRLAGARFLDAPVVVDGHLVTSRRPSDLPDFVVALLAQLGLAAVG